MSKIGNMVSTTVAGIISAVIFILIGVALGPTVIEAVVDINATTLSGIPLAGVIVLLGTYVPAFYYLAVVLGGMVGIWAAVRYGGN
jgi:multisubunit Na+/H+ antiporter MnhF subunit